VLLALIRTEGVAWVAVIALLAVGSRRSAGQLRLGDFARFGVFVGAPYALYQAWRIVHFGDLLPNIVYAKTGLHLLHYERGLDYVVVYFLTFATPLLMFATSVPALRAGRRAAGGTAVAMAWAFPVFAVAAGGDFMAMGRFLVPGLPFATLLLAWTLQDLAAGGRWRRVAAGFLGLSAIAAGALPAWDRHLVPEEIRARFHFRHQSGSYRSEHAQWAFQAANAAYWRRLGRALAAYAPGRLPPEPSLVTSATGAVGYFSDFRIFDQAGLVDRRVARRRISPDEPLRSPGHDKLVGVGFFLAQQPALIRARLEPGTDPAQVASRLRAWAQALSALRHPEITVHYAPDFARLAPTGPPEHLFVWRAIDPARFPVAEDAWRDFEERRLQLAGTGEAVTLPIAEPRTD
jgi:hypothetical protein